MSGTVNQPKELLNKEAILGKLAQLPAALFEVLVFQFDKYNSVPGREAPQLIRATELLRLVDIQTDGLARLWRSCCEITGAQSQVSTHLPGTIKPVKVEELIGILIDPEAGHLGEALARYAFAQVHNTINSDLLRRSDESIVSALVWNLADVSAQDNKYSNLLAFAVLCHDHAAGLGRKSLKEKLRAWIDRACQGAPFGIESVRANFPMQDYERIYRVAIEIAWPVPISNSSKSVLPPEAYIRWGRLRQRIDQNSMPSDRHQAITDLLNSTVTSEAFGMIQVDHVEIFVDPSEMLNRWEYRPGASIHDENPDFQPYPVVVRSTVHSSTRAHRPCPNNMISSEDIACNVHQGERFLEIIQDHGVFVTTVYAPNNLEIHKKIKAAISLASIGIWSRAAYSADDRLREILIDCSVDDVPARVHGRRTISEPGSIWRDVVTLFDPNLPPFKFSYEVYDSSHQISTNTALS